MNRIDAIKLIDVVPKIFANDSDHETLPSDVWRTKLVIQRGNHYCIDAASGTGKTSLCSFVYGVRRDYLGKILFNSTDIGTYSINDWCEIRRRHIAYLPQELDVFDELTAIDNVLLKNRLTDYKSETDIRRLFEELEIDNRIDTPAGRMSVGQRQRVAIIRALCQPFDFIILDEPVSHLDEKNNIRCAEMISDEAKRQEAGIIYTSVGNRLAIGGDVLKL